ncbi:DgyrCDS14652 [Dimorphilus gyrociliatus]|uniref:DgyrCDS14652 n=1 Tax=Dimorphilus gyrociliatus TaxID=2664684 RepID=A0A7I8WEB6_9ANNE|nr:DgyrCDS14652 [Dimorphilus gyrociliatus]
MKMMGRQSYFTLSLLFLTCLNAFEFFIKYTSLITTNSRPLFNIEKFIGSPTCSLKTRKPDGTELYRVSLDLTDSIIYHTFPDNIFQNIEKVVTITHSFTCTEGENSASFDLKSQFFPVDYIPQLFEVKIKISMMEESSKDIFFFSDGFKTYCNYSIPNANEASLNKYEKVFIDKTEDIVTATKIGSTKSTLMRLTCEIVESAEFSLEIPIYFTLNSDPWTSVSGDPHMKQIVLDYPSLITKAICYDVSGSPGDYLHIAGFSLSGIQVYGQLKDDYYMHKIIIKSDSGKITTSTNHIILDNGQLINWTGNMQKSTFKSKEFQYLITRNHVFITSLENGGKMIKIEKSIHSSSENHLDASFKLSPDDYKEMDGLVGDIGKKKYIFHEEIQSDRNIGSKFISIDIDNKIIKGVKVERGNEECWLINVNDILKPFNISKYLYKTMHVF